MATVLGRDFAARMAAQFGGRLYDASFTKTTPGAINVGDAAGAPTDTTDTYTCSAIAFSYGSEFIDGEKLKMGDYRVTILLGTIVDEDEEPAPGIIPSEGDTITVPPPGQSTPITGRVTGVSVLTQAQVTVHVRGSTS